MRQLQKQKIQKVIAAVSSLALALTVTAPFVDGSLGFKASAAAVKTESGGLLWDLDNGSIVTQSTDFKTDLTSDGLTIKAGSGYRLNGGKHGIELPADGALEVKVDGPTKLVLGDCAYSNASSVTVTSADGSYNETKSTKTGCYHNGSEIAFNYGGAATTLKVQYNGKAYVPAVVATPQVPDNNGAKRDSIMFYESTAIITEDHNDANPLNGTLTSKDGMVSITSKGGLYLYNVQHGFVLTNGDVIEVKVAGNATVKFNLCQYSVDGNSKLVATSPKGEFIGETSQPLAKFSQLDGMDMISYRYEGVATTLKFTVQSANEGLVYMHSFEVANDPEDPAKPVGNGKIDVWDFGAEQLDSSKYNNMVTVDLMNSFPYTGTLNAEKKGVTIGTFMIGEDMFFCGGGKTNNRVRTTNKDINRYDEKSLTMGDTVYSGYLYSNMGSAGVYTGHKLYPGDILTVIMSSNGGDATVYCESPSGKIQVGQSNSKGAELTFYASEYGIYKLYVANGEKLTLFRAYREHTAPVQVSGKVDTSAASSITSKNYAIKFTNRSNGSEVVAKPVNGTYTATLNEQYTYDISLVDANGYIIKGSTELNIPKGKGNLTNDIKIETVDLVTITGKITGLSADALKKLKLSFVNKDHAYVPEFTVSGDSISVQLEKGVSYDIVAEDVNDYTLAKATISKTANGTENIAFNAKPTYNVNVKYSGLLDSVAKSAVLTFTNINEEGYVYTFKAGETPKLRDGSYTVKVTGTGAAPYVQKLTSNVTVKGKAVDKTISFEKLETWDFSKYNAGNPGLETINGKPYYLGLELTESNVMENKTYLLVNEGGEVKFSVKKGQMITLEYCYQAAFDINGDQILSSSGSTSKMETVSFVAPEDTSVVIKGISGTTEDGKSAKQTYFTKIIVADPVAYKAQVTVGKNKEYKTINDALAAVSKMNRPNGERVEIVIDPGNYEEMLTVNTPNVTLKNAAGKDSSLNLVNKGVDIGKNVVRITSYYGHGYDYYSMGADCKWDADVLAANKENGYISKKNPGSGKTDGSYWNSTVVVYANGFEADGIVFENSFNQYISKKEAADTVVMWETGSKGQRPTKYGDTSVQERSFVERAGAVALVGDKAVFNNCKFVGRQDVLYGDAGIQAAFQKCDILGAVDYIYGGMNAVFYQCKLRMNTDSKSASDQAYLTAAQQTSGRGYLMYNCTVTSTTPGVDTASEYRAKPGYFGRPWTPNTADVVFYNTVVETTNHPGSEGKSLIVPEGWNNTLSGESKNLCEYGTLELSKENNSASRAKWASTLSAPKIDGGKTDISIKAFLGDWTTELNARGLLLELTDAQMNKEASAPAEDENPRTGMAGVATAIAVAALAGASILVAKKRK